MKKIIFSLLFTCLLPIVLWGQTTVHMPSEANAHLKVNITDPQAFEGPQGSLESYESMGITFTPRANEVIKIDFTEIHLSKTSYVQTLLSFLDGEKSLDSESDDVRISVSGEKTSFSIYSLADDGKLTVRLKTIYNTAASWKATVSSVPKPTLTAQPATDPVLISCNPTIYNIGSSPINFYDDGGASDKISFDFKGYVTFKPTTAGKKVKIDFKKVQLFYSQSAVNVGKQDILNVYNGTEVSESLLNTTLVNEPEVVKSSASDGALTVLLKSKTGSIRGNGWEAVVSEFTPAQMIYDAAELVQFTEGTVSAGDETQPILSVNVKTKNSLNPVKAETFAFSTNNTFAQIAKATLYYTGKNKDFSTKTKVGEVAVHADKFEVVLTAPQILAEGDNYFWLAYDIKEQAIQEQVIDAGCEAVTVSGEKKNIADVHPEGNRKVKNTHLSVEGTTTRTLYGEWGFEHTKTSEYNSNYATGTTDQIVTFKAPQAGDVVEIDFKRFKVTYVAYTGQTKAKFIIYDGEGTAGNKLFEADATNKDTGPQKLIRSTGQSMTVVFNPNTTYSGQTNKGWEATVRSYTPQDMEVKQVTAFQNNTDIITPSATNEEIIGVEIITEGNRLPLSLDEFLINLKGSHDKISKVSLFATGDKKVFATTNLIASATSFSASDLTLVPGAAETLKEGKNYFWIAYDMKDVLTSDQAIDASLTSVKIGGKTQTPDVTDPDGNRVTKNIYLFKGGNETVHVANTLMFYDNGGAESNYSSDAKGTVTFVPRTGEVIKFIFKSFNTRYNDYFYIYDGGIDGNELAKYSGTTLVGSKLPKPIVSTAADGSLTVKFEPKYSYNAGWEIEVQSYVPQPFSISSIKAEDVSSAEVLRGEEAKMLKIEVEVVGDNGAIDITSFEFLTENTTNIANITGANLYFTGEYDVFATTDLYAKSTTKPFNMTGNTNISQIGKYYFWLTYDVASDAPVNNTLEAKLASIKLNGSTPAPTVASAVASSKVKAGFKGTYTIGASTDADYHTFEAAIAAMAEGIDGAVVFEIENGTYDKLVKIPHIAGVSDKNTITFKSKSGDCKDVLIEVNTYNAPGYNEYKPGVFTINGADYVTLESISIKTDKTSYPAVVLVDNTSRHVTLRNCCVEAPKTTSVSQNISLVRVNGMNEANQNCDYFTVEECVLNGGRTGVYIGGTGYVALPKQKGAKIIQNKLSNQGFVGIYLTKEHDAVVDGNIIKVSGNTNNEMKPIDAVMSGNTTVSNNRIYADNTVTGRVKGLYLRDNTDKVHEAGRNRIYNNEVIIDNSIHDDQYGIYINGKLFNIDIVYNSVNIVSTNEKPDSYAFYMLNKMPQSMTVENNILQNNAKGMVYWIGNKKLFAQINFANNASYTTGAEFAKATDDIATFADWVVASGEQNAVNDSVKFLSDKSLFLLKKGNLSTAKPLSFVTTDINRITRSSSTPTIGAYEFTEALMPNVASQYPKVTNITHVSAEVRMKLTENGRVFMVIKKAGEAMPTQAELLAGKQKTLTKNTEELFEFTGLEAKSEYKVYYLLQSLKNENSGVVAMDAFETAFQPTAVSTFEGITQVAAEDFEDGTALFSGFKVEDAEGAVGGSTKVATVAASSQAVITITNTTDGIVIRGFFMKNRKKVTLYGERGNGEATQTLTIQPRDEWQYVDIKSLGMIKKLVFNPSEEAFSIDNLADEPLALGVTITASKFELNENESLEIQADVSGGVKPYSYVWKPLTEITTRTATIKPAYTTLYEVTVTDSQNKTASASQLIKVNASPGVLHFESFALAPESYWKETKDSVYHRYENGFEIMQKVAYNGSSWSGTTYSNKTNKDVPGGFAEQWTAITGGGVGDSQNYGVLYVFGNAEIKNMGSPAVIKGMRVTNNTWAVTSMKKGDAYTKKFGGNTGNDPDWFKLTVKGYNGTVHTGDVEYYLADFRFDDNKRDYIVEDWRYVDLTSLGKVTKLTFALSSSDNGGGGQMNTPAYLCIDNLNAEDKAPIVKNAIADVIAQIGAEPVEIDITDTFDDEDDDNALMTMSVTSSNATLVTPTLVKNKLILTFAPDKFGEATILITAKSKTKTVIVEFKVTVKQKLTDVGNIAIPEIQVYPNPASDWLSINTSGKVDIFTQSGQKIYTNPHYVSNTVIHTGNYAKGMYIVVVNGHTVKLIIK